MGLGEQLDPLSSPCSHSLKQETGVPLYLPASETLGGLTGHAASLTMYGKGNVSAENFV